MEIGNGTDAQTQRSNIDIYKIVIKLVRKNLNKMSGYSGQLWDLQSSSGKSTEHRYCHSD
jgi:hypothetical protein